MSRKERKVLNSVQSRRLDIYLRDFFILIFLLSQNLYLFFKHYKHFEPRLYPQEFIVIILIRLPVNRLVDPLDISKNCQLVF